MDILGKVSGFLGTDKIVEKTENKIEAAVGRVVDDVETTGRALEQFKIDVVDTLQVTIILAFILVGGLGIIYGPDLFASFRAISERIRAGGIELRI